MSGFSDPIAAGDGDLIRSRIKSPNYVAGTTGWSINQAGDAEFNNVNILGTLYLPDGVGGYIRVRIVTTVPTIELRPDDDTGTNYAAGQISAQGTGSPVLIITGPYDQNVTPVDRPTITMRGSSTANPLLKSVIDLAAQNITMNPAGGVIIGPQLSGASGGALQVGDVNPSAPGAVASAVSGAGSLAYSAEVSVTDSVPRFVIRGDGLLGWGPGGSTARDTNLYRSAANYLTTDDAFKTAGIFYSSAFITPVANTPTSLAITGLTLPTGLTYTAHATASTTLIGSTVKGVAISSPSATGVTLWVYRTDTTNTNVMYKVVGQ